jgi:hypothetical protein
MAFVTLQCLQSTSPLLSNKMPTDDIFGIPFLKRFEILKYVIENCRPIASDDAIKICGTFGDGGMKTVCFFHYSNACVG